MSKSLKKEMRSEFSRVLPNVLPAVLSTPINVETVEDNDIVFKKLNFRMAFAASAIIFGCALVSAGGYSYYNPNTYLTITFNADAYKNLLNLSTEEVFSNDESQYVLSLGVNPYDYVVEIDANDEDLKAAITKLGIKNHNVSRALNDIVSYAQQEGYVDFSHNHGHFEMNVLSNYNKHANRLQDYVHNFVSQNGFNQSMIMFVPDYFYLTGADGSSNERFSFAPFKPQMNSGRMAAIQEILFTSNKYSIDDLMIMSNYELAQVLMKVKSQHKRVPN